MDISLLRNIGVIAHIDAGKTTFTERVLFYSDVIHRMGEVHEGAATMDFMPEEQERGITIGSACITCSWSGYTVNIVDTPGHVDFTVEVERSLRVLDGAIGLFCAVSGVEPQSETVWRQADAFDLPRLAVINKMDRAGASFDLVLIDMEERLGILPVPLVVPVGAGDTLTALLDIVREERLTFNAQDQGRSIVKARFTEEDESLAAPYRDRLLDALTEHDDVLLEHWLSGESIPQEMLVAAIRTAVLDRRIVPVFATSALRNMGIQPVLDAVCAYLPSPLDTPGILAHPTGTVESEDRKELHITPDVDEALCALAFKVLVEGARKLVLLRLYAGTLQEGDTVLNASTGCMVKVQRLYRLYADRREQADIAVAGDIIAVIGLKDVTTGQTICAPSRPVLLEPLREWSPVISLALEPKGAAEGERLDEVLAYFVQEDPTLTYTVDEETGQRLISGMGELHLEVVCERLQRQFSLSPRVGNPQVICRETITGSGKGEALFDRLVGEQMQFGHVGLSVEPRERGSGTLIQRECDAEGWPQSLLAAVEEGITSGLATGTHGFGMEDILVRVTSLGTENRPTEAGLHIAARAACLEALAEARPVVLEPLMSVLVAVPEAFLGGVISLLTSKGAKVENVLDRGGVAQLKEVVATASMRKLFGFATELRSVSQGRAGVNMQFLRFDTI